MKSMLTFITLSLGLLGCGPGPKNEPSGVIPQGQLNALEKAKNMDEEMKKRTDDINKKMKEAE